MFPPKSILLLVGQMQRRPKRNRAGEIAIGMLTGGRIQVPAVEVGALLLGSLLSLIIAIPSEDLLSKPLQFIISLFVATLAAIMWKTILYLLIRHYHNKPRNIYSCVTNVPTFIDPYLPPQFVRLKWIVQLIQKNICIAIISGVWILVFLMYSQVQMRIHAI